jgi:osmotically-inducible protein OsmY
VPTARTTLLATLIPIAILLSGCSGLGVATTGVQAVYDRYNLQKSFYNHEIAGTISTQVTNEQIFPNCYIGVSVFHSQVLLTGTTSTETLRKKAAEIAAYTPHVQHVYNFIRVGPTPSHSSIVKDTWITTKIKSKIIATAKMDPGSVKVVTDGSVVYLMGFITPQEAEIVTSTAQHTNGVKQVVRIFEYITLSARPPAQ